jgi:Tetratricopeptide repeat
LAPNLIPDDLLTDAADKLPWPLKKRAADPMAWGKTLGMMTKQSLARIDHGGLQMHRLTQAILRDRLRPSKAVSMRARTEAILCAYHLGNPQDPSSWARWARLMPHLLAADLGATANPGLRALACSASWYLQARGDDASSRDLASHLFQQWRDRLGPDDPSTMSIAQTLANALRALGEVQAARDLDEDTLARRRRVIGDDDHDTLMAANHLANGLGVLGEVQAACDLDEDTLARSRRMLGEDHQNTLDTAHNLAIDLRLLGEVQAARDLDEDTHARRRMLSEDHPD